MIYCDLHCHSTYSDGSYTPQELINSAIEARLGAIALTDHNTLEGYADFLKAAEGRIEACIGCEFSTEIDGLDLHLLGLFLDYTQSEEIRKQLAAQLERKEQSNRLTIENLAKDGYSVSYQEFANLFNEGSKNRVHIARYLIQKGIIGTIEDAFRDLLADNSKYIHKSSKMNFYDTIRLINKANGISIWAHPLVDVKDRNTCRNILKKAKKIGLDGVEVYHSKFNSDEIAFMESLCKEYNLLPSGGSDFHGSNKKDVALGIGKGNVYVPYDWYKNLKTKAEERRKSFAVR